MFETLTERLDEGIREIMLFLPRLAAALGTLMVGLFIAKMVERGTDLMLHRIGFDRWMREGGVTEALERAGTHLDPSTVIAKLVFWTVMLLVILAAAMVLGVTAVNMLFAELLAYIPKVIAAVVVLVIGILIGEFIKDLVLASAGGIQAGPTLARLAKASIVLLAVFMALEQLEIAQEVVLVFFIGVVGAAALAAGIAFGLGGRDVAALIAREWYERSRGHPPRRPGSGPASPSTGSPPFPETPPGDRRE